MKLNILICQSHDLPKAFDLTHGMLGVNMRRRRGRAGDSRKDFYPRALHTQKFLSLNASKPLDETSFNEPLFRVANKKFLLEIKHNDANAYPKSICK